MILGMARVSRGQPTVRERSDRQGSAHPQHFDRGESG
jgi:hypothetical protein